MMIIDKIFSIPEVFAKNCQLCNKFYLLIVARKVLILIVIDNKLILFFVYNIYK